MPSSLSYNLMKYHNYHLLQKCRAGIMAEVASLYFERGLSQQEIADRLFFSRSKVSRLLSKAIEEKVEEIKINYPLEPVF